MSGAAAPALRWVRVRLALCCALTIAATPQTASAQPGSSPTVSARDAAWLFTYSIVPTAAGQAVKGGTQVMDVAIWNGVVRITVREGALRLMTGDRGTMLLRARDSMLFVINPARRDVLRGSLSDLGAMMGGPGGSAPLEVVDVRSATRDRGVAAPLLRYATRRVELTQRYTLRISAPGVKRELRTEQMMTVDVSRDIATLDAGFRVFADQFSWSPGLPDTVRRVLRAAERGMPAGFPVRSTTVGTTVAGSDTLRTTTRSELTQFRREAVDTTTFVVPADYRLTEMTRLLQQRRRP